MEKISYNLVFNRKKRLNKRNGVSTGRGLSEQKNVFLHQNISQTRSVDANERW